MHSDLGPFEYETYKNSECGCVERTLQVGIVDVIIHIEPSGQGEAFLFFGDWDEELSFKNCIDIDDLENRVRKNIEARPHE